MAEIKAMMTMSSGYKSSDKDMLDNHVERHKDEHNWRQFDPENVPDSTVLEKYGPSTEITENAKQMMTDIGFLDSDGIANHDKKYVADSQAKKRYGDMDGYVNQITKLIRHGFEKTLINPKSNNNRRKDASMQLRSIEANHGIPITSTLLYVANTDVYDQLSDDSNQLARFREAERDSLTAYQQSAAYNALHKHVLAAEIDSDEEGSQHLQSSELFTIKDRFGNQTFNTTQAKEHLLQSYYYGDDAWTKPDGNKLPILKSEFENDWQSKISNYKTDKGKEIKIADNGTKKDGKSPYVSKTAVIKGLYHDAELHELEKQTIPIMKQYGFDYTRIRGLSEDHQRTANQYKADRQAKKDRVSKQKNIDSHELDVKRGLVAVTASVAPNYAITYADKSESERIGTKKGYDAFMKQSVDWNNRATNKALNAKLQSISAKQTELSEKQSQLTTQQKSLKTSQNAFVQQQNAIKSAIVDSTADLQPNLKGKTKKDDGSVVETDEVSKPAGKESFMRQKMDWIILQFQIARDTTLQWIKEQKEKLEKREKMADAREKKQNEKETQLKKRDAAITDREKSLHNRDQHITKRETAVTLRENNVTEKEDEANKKTKEYEQAIEALPVTIDVNADPDAIWVAHKAVIQSFNPKYNLGVIHDKATHNITKAVIMDKNRKQYSVSQMVADTLDMTKKNGITPNLINTFGYIEQINHRSKYQRNVKKHMDAGLEVSEAMFSANRDVMDDDYQEAVIMQREKELDGPER